MNVQEQIKEDMVTAMKNRNTEKVSLLRVVIGEFGRIGKELSDEEALKVIRKMNENAINMRNKSEVTILDKYLPQMLTEDEIRVMVVNIINEQGFNSIKDMGSVMKLLRSPLIDGKIASRLVKEKLSK